MVYEVMKRLLGPLLRFFFQVRVEGLENVPATGPAILAGNHVSFSDSIFLPLVIERRVTFVAKAEYFEDPKTAWFFRAVGQIPLKRGGGTASERALDAAAEVLDAGGLFGIYPEGTRSPDGRLYKGHTGVARLALRTGAPVLAVAMIGTREIQPIGRVVPNVFLPVTIRISGPLDLSRYAAEADNPMTPRRMTDEIMFEVRELSGQSYVDRYARRGGEESLDATGPARLRTASEMLGPSPKAGGNGTGRVALSSS